MSFNYFEEAEMNLALMALVLGLSACVHSEVTSAGDLCVSGQDIRSAAFERVSEGSVDDFGPVVASFACLDGGELQDAHLAVGEGVFRNPAQFAPLMHSRGLLVHDVIAISRMLPAKFADEHCNASAELNRRQHVVQQTAAFGSWRAVMLDAIRRAHAVEETRCALEQRGAMDTEAMRRP